jgi:hypothetical protein
LSSTNIALPTVNWTQVATSLFDASGQFRVTNAVSPIPQQFFLIQLP